MSLTNGKELVVALGGGHGLAASLRSLVLAGADPLGVVSVADDGGSSGRIRADFGLEPPGDVRKCLVALAAHSSIWTSVFDYRFESGELSGHSLGNLIIAGLTEVTGDFTFAIKLAQDLIGAKGALLPSSTEPVTLAAKVGGQVVIGQVNVMRSSGIESVYTIPESPPVPEAVLAAIKTAGTIVAGPGSLFTSVLAVLCVPGIQSAVKESFGQKIYVVNLRQQPSETLDFNISDHIRALVEYGFVPDLILADNAFMELGDSLSFCKRIGAKLVVHQLADPSGRVHDPILLANAFKEYG